MKTTRIGEIAAEVAETMFERMRGLIGRETLEPGKGMHILKCNCIHTFFMRFPIDATFLDRDGRVVKVHPTAMPRLQGETLKDVLARNPQGLGLDEAVHLALEIGRQLREGVHGNLSPRTVFLCRDETVVLTDFGRPTDLSVYSAPDFL